VAAEQITKTCDGVYYFPSYEIITSPNSRGRYYGEDLREVTSEGVSHVMDVFRRRHLSDGAARNPGPVRRTARKPAKLTAEDQRRLHELAGVVCDEDLIDA
jgi:hypothetical protein